jgi:hypothetical protein
VSITTLVTVRLYLAAQAAISRSLELSLRKTRPSPPLLTSLANIRADRLAVLARNVHFPPIADIDASAK